MKMKMASSNSQSVVELADMKNVPTKASKIGKCSKCPRTFVAKKLSCLHYYCDVCLTRRLKFDYYSDIDACLPCKQLLWASHPIYPTRSTNLCDIVSKSLGSRSSCLMKSSVTESEGITMQPDENGCLQITKQSCSVESYDQNMSHAQTPFEPTCVLPRPEFFAPVPCNAARRHTVSGSQGTDITSGNECHKLNEVSQHGSGSKNKKVECESSGYFIGQNSSFGNMSLPVLPRIPDSSCEK